MQIDLAALLNLTDTLKPAMDDAAKRAAQMLTAATHAHIVEQVQGKLRSSREKYLDNLSFHQLDEHTWQIDLQKGAMFIEEGLPPNFDMIDSLLDDSPKSGAGQKSSSKTKTAKDGSRYRVIPFNHSKGPARQTPYQNNLTDAIKAELKRQGAPGIGKIEKDANGVPKEGFVRGFNIMDRPLKSSQGSGMGKGPMGMVRQGPTGIPLLKGVSIYQRKVVDKQGKSSMKKFAMTFRIVSSKMKGTGRWVHPGLEPRKFMDEAFEWAMKEWETKMQPEILASLAGGL